MSLTYPKDLIYLKEGFTFQHKGGIAAITTDHQDKVLFSICLKNVLKIWNITSGNLLKKFSLGKENLQINNIFFLVKSLL